MLEVNQHIRIPDDEFQWTFVRASGPGGQNVNKVASRALLRWDLAASPSVPADVKARLQQQQHRRITGQGELLVSSQRFRDQGRNIQDCLDKLRAVIQQAATPPRPRRPTRPTRASHRARLQEKRRHTTTKQRRRPPGEE